MPNKQFAERLNKGLDTIGMPTLNNERIESFAKLIKVPKFKAEAFLNGSYLPNPELMEQIARELEVDTDWLLGKSKESEN